MNTADVDGAPVAILVADEQVDVLKAIRLLLRKEGFEVETATSPACALDALKRRSYDALLMDLNYTRGCTNGREGLGLLSRIREVEDTLPVIVMTAWGSIGLAVEVMRQGASDFVLKPWENERLVATLRTQVELGRARRSTRRLEEENRLLRSESVSNLIAHSRSMRPVLEVVNRTAASDANILITGENGTGKSMLARAIHEASLRRDKPLVVVDASSLSSTVFESELFGHVKGAFTDAVSDRLGRLECAAGGTLFLDEIANLPAALQSKFLRAIETGEYEPVGSSKTRRADVRLISASNTDIHEAVARGQFRQDLLYRLNTVEIHLPPLRDRREDIPLLAQHFLTKHGLRYRGHACTLHPAALETALQYPWPGNVRELDHALERAVLMAPEEGVVRREDLGLRSPGATASFEQMTLDEMERMLIAKALSQHESNIKATARSLGISRSALYRKIEKFGL